MVFVVSVFSDRSVLVSSGSSYRLIFTNLPAHENIVPVLHTFVDNFPLLPDAVDTYPAALPLRYHEDGFGRNKSLFLVMPRLDFL